jgi:Ion channel
MRTSDEQPSGRPPGTVLASGGAIPAGIPARSSVTSGLFRFSATQFLVALILVLVANPFLSELHRGEVIVSVSMTLVLISAVLAVGGSGRLLVLTIFLLLPALGAEWVDHYQPGLVPAWETTCVGLVFVGFVVWQLVRFILLTPRVNSDVLSAGISAYLLLGLVWAAAYLLVAKLTPHAFSLVSRAPGAGPMDRFDALYFSFVTLTCLGCNDIVPVSRVARMLMMVEAATGVLYLGVMIARLVALYSRPNVRETA